MDTTCDYLVVGTGLAGLAYALKVADSGRVIILAKKTARMNNSRWAQGGIAAVTADDDSFELHIKDTEIAGAGLCHSDVVRMVVDEGPERIKDLQSWGVRFDLKTDHASEEIGVLDLTREGGHSRRRVLHVQDHTGREVQEQLLRQVLAHPHIQVLENHVAIDLLTNRKVDPTHVGRVTCLGAYVLNALTGHVFSVVSRATVLATGGAGKVYLYTSNWEGATGDGIAMAFRAGARVANLEFMQFHPTCLFHHAERSFLISEAVRGEGGELVNNKGEAFMKKYHPLGSLAPRDIVARSIDAEMKRTGAESVFLDISHKPADFIKSHFPVIFERCLELGIDMTKLPIPVVPAAHYLCGGVVVDRNGESDIQNLFVIGESSCTGLHGANRLASNSLLECLVYAHNAGTYTTHHVGQSEGLKFQIPAWVSTESLDSDEMIVITHMWDEIRRLMWNYVGIVRSNKRLKRAHDRLKLLVDEVHEYYWHLKVHPDILELRNIALVALLTVECALRRKESRGIHYSLDYPPKAAGGDLPPGHDTIVSSEAFVGK